MKTQAYTSSTINTGVNWTSLLASVLGTLLITFAALSFCGLHAGYNTINLPELMPTETAFKILHLAVFALYGYALHRVITAPFSPSTVVRNSTAVRYKKVSAALWVAGLILSTAWLPLLFSFNLYIFAFIWLSFFTAVCTLTMILNLKIDRLASLSLLPLAVWLSFLTYLNLAAALIN